jgi:hypothetical protein
MANSEDIYDDEVEAALLEVLHPFVEDIPLPSLQDVEP